MQYRRHGFDPWVRTILWRRTHFTSHPCQESRDRGAWWAMVRMVTKSQTAAEVTACMCSFGRNSCDIGPFNHMVRIYSRFLIFLGTRLNFVGILKSQVLCHCFALLKFFPPDLVGTKTSLGCLFCLSLVVLHPRQGGIPDQG